MFQCSLCEVAWKVSSFLITQQKKKKKEKVFLHFHFADYADSAGLLVIEK